MKLTESESFADVLRRTPSAKVSFSHYSHTVLISTLRNTLRSNDSFICARTTRVWCAKYRFFTITTSWDDYITRLNVEPAVTSELSDKTTRESSIYDEMEMAMSYGPQTYMLNAYITTFLAVNRTIPCHSHLLSKYAEFRLVGVEAR